MVSLDNSSRALVNREAPSGFERWDTSFSRRCSRQKQRALALRGPFDTNIQGLQISGAARWNPDKLDTKSLSGGLYNVIVVTWVNVQDEGTGLAFRDDLKLPLQIINHGRSSRPTAGGVIHRHTLAHFRINLFIEILGTSVRFPSSEEGNMGIASPGRGNSGCQSILASASIFTRSCPAS